MTQTTLVSADQTLAFADNSMPQGLIDAWSYTTTFAQAHARTVNGDASTQQYFDAMTRELQEIGWNVTNAGRLNYDQSANRISPASIVKSIIHPYLSPDQQRQLDGLLDAIGQPDVSISNFLDFWWKKASVSASKANMAMGPLTERNNSSDIKMIYYGFTYDASSWRSLFVEQDSASLGVTAYNLEMNLNLALYKSVSGDLIAKLAGKEKQHIQQTTLDL
jgi:hypothetical protein